jgi:hypothetical protein
MPRQRRAELTELRELIERHVGDVVADQVRGQLGRWNSPAAKVERKIRRASTLLTVWIVVTLIAGVAAVVGLLGAITADEGYDQVLGGVTMVIIGGAMSTRSGLRLRALRRRKRELGNAAGAANSRQSLPPRQSAAREPMRRLAEAERTLHDLLDRAGSAGGMPADSVEQARTTGIEAASALRSVADRLQAVERAREHAPVAERPALDEAIGRIVAQLDDGMDGYGTLIAAAGRLVAASSADGPDHQALTDATDHLHGLAMALRELFPRRP